MFLELIEKQNRRTFDFNIIKSFQLDTIYKDQYGDGHETFRAIRHSIIGISVDFALVFDDRVESWAEFFNGRFEELLIPHFLKISKLANTRFCRLVKTKFTQENYNKLIIFKFN